MCIVKKVFILAGKKEEGYPVQSLRALSKQGKQKIYTEGILTSIKEDVTKGGKPYIKGYLSDKENFIPIKIWNTDMSQLPENWESTAYIVSGTLDVFDSTPQLSVEWSCLYPSELPHKAFEDTAMIEGNEAVTNIVSMLNQDSDACKVAATILCNLYLGCRHAKSTITKIPYGEDAHIEYGGLMQHIYDCIHQAKDIHGLNQNVVISAIAAYRVFIMLYFNDENVFNKERYLLDGNTQAVKALVWAESKVHPQESAEYLNFRHTYMALNELVPPRTNEALWCLRIVQADLEINKAIKTHSLFSESDLEK